jgi:SAM-dependent methyltransferase
VDQRQGEGKTSGDVVAESVAIYSEDPDAFATFTASAVAVPFVAFEALLQPSSTVLDAGCGPGRDLARLAERGHRGVGVDLNRDLVDRARAHGPVILGDLRALPLPAASFDAVWASASLIHLPYEDAAVALREIARVAKPRAPVSVSVKTDGVTGWADDTPIGRRWFSICTTGDFAGAVEKAGLSIEDVLDDGRWMEVRARR